MRIEVKGRNVPVGDDLRARVEKRFEKVARQVSPLARMEVELSEERNPSIRESHVAEANLYLKGVTLRARDSADSAVHAINLVADELSRQVKRHRDKRRGRRDAHEGGAHAGARARAPVTHARARSRGAGTAPRPLLPLNPCRSSIVPSGSARGRSTGPSRSASRASTSSSPRWSSSRTPSCASTPTRCASGPGPASPSTTSSPSPSRSRARPPGARLGMRHFDVQLIGGMVLHDGSIAEMKTGEGKTLTATLAVVLNTLGGDGVHLVTVNDYLARRDAEWMRPIYDALGVTVGVLQSGERDELKHAAYAADVTYGTNSEFGFDFLRDNLALSLEEKYQRGRSFAIVDEVDNILIDEARTPLIISGAPEQAADLYYRFAQLAPRLEPGKKPEGWEAKTKEWQAEYDYEPDEKHKTVAITERGVEKAERFLGIENLYLAEHGNLVNHLIQALKAESLYKRDVDYAVIDGEVKIIDEFTGRILEGRRWSEGLHQAVEAKEGVAIQEENQTVATITYQNYFRKYDKLAGMTGTALTEATEFMKIYELQVVEVPTNRPMVREDQNDQIYKTKAGKWSAVATRSTSATRRASRCSWARSPSRSPSSSPPARGAGRPARGAQRQARVRRARGRDDRRGRAHRAR